MDIVNTIKNRKMTRAFQSKPVNKEMVQKLLEAAIMAPSGSNAQPWKFYVVTGEKKKEVDALMQTCAEEGVRFSLRQTDIEAKLGGRSAQHKNDYNIAYFKLFTENNLTFEETAQFLLRHYDAPVAIFITLERLRQNVFIGGADTGGAIENILLTACGMGLGACWITFPYMRTKSAAPKIKKYLNIPADEKIVSSIAIGYPDEQSPLNKFKSPRDEFGSFVKWFGFE